MTRDRLRLEIRAHHLLCLPGYRGLGYSDEFTQNMRKVSAAAFADGAILKIVDRCDAICVLCPHRKGNECGKEKDSAAKIRKQDQAVAARLGVRIEDEVRSPEIWTLVRCRIRPPDLPQLCGECEWLGYCLNGERWRGATLLASAATKCDNTNVGESGRGTAEIMDITWLGHSCFILKGKATTVVTDPFDKTSGYHPGKITADIVTISHEHPRHSFASGIGGDPKVLRGPGEYEISGVFTYGIRTFHDREKGLKMGKNTIYLMAIDDINVCHLGDLGHVLSASLTEEISETDILLVPVGGRSTIDASAAAEVINLVQPRIVIPMHYKTSASTMQLDSLDKFLKEMGIKDVSPLPKLTMNKAALPIETEVRVLDFRGS